MGGFAFLGTPSIRSRSVPSLREVRNPHNRGNGAPPKKKKFCYPFPLFKNLAGGKYPRDLGIMSSRWPSPYPSQSLQHRSWLALASHLTAAPTVCFLIDLRQSDRGCGRTVRITHIVVSRQTLGFNVLLRSASTRTQLLALLRMKFSSPCESRITPPPYTPLGFPFSLFQLYAALARPLPDPFLLREDFLI